MKVDNLDRLVVLYLSAILMIVSFIATIPAKPIGPSPGLASQHYLGDENGYRK